MLLISVLMLGRLPKSALWVQQKKHKFQDTYYHYNFNYFGVVDCNKTHLSNDHRNYGKDAQEITLDQLDEWLGLEVERKWKNGDECVFDNKTKREFDNPLLDNEYQNQHAMVHHTFKNKHKFDMVLIEFEDGYCTAFMQECISKPETPEQKAERELYEAIEDGYNLAPDGLDIPINQYVAKLLYQQGYRKQ